MIFLDTSALYALADRADPNHASAVKMLDRLLDSRELLLTHNYVIVESMALIQHRLGLDAVVKLARSTKSFHIVWVDARLHEDAVQRLRKTSKRHLSLVDHVSFHVMMTHGLDTAFAFDEDFTAAGFKLYH